MKEKIASEHIEVIKTMLEAGMIGTQQAKTIRGQVLKMNTFAEREEYLKKQIKEYKPK
jgi:hypothetical protein